VGFSCLFDKRDNCFQDSINQMAIKTNNHKTTIKRLFVALRERDLIVDVVDISGKQRVMLKPSFIAPREHNNYYYMLAQYYLGSAKQAWVYVSTCITLGLLIHPHTGEILGRYENKIMHLWRNSYESSDRSKRRTNINKYESIDNAVIDYKGVTMIQTNERLTPQLLYKLGIKSAYID